MLFHDVSTGLRMIRKNVVDDLELESTSPFVGAEIAIKTMLKGYAIGEVGIQTSRVRQGATVSVTNTSRPCDGLRVYRHVFRLVRSAAQSRARLMAMERVDLSLQCFWPDGPGAADVERSARVLPALRPRHRHGAGMRVRLGEFISTIKAGRKIAFDVNPDVGPMLRRRGVPQPRSRADAAGDGEWMSVSSATS
jgi:hypothetical protein